MTKQGALAQFWLWEWWETTFTAEQRRFILDHYSPYLIDGVQSPLTDGLTSFRSARHFLSSTAMWFNNPVGFEIAIKFMDKAQTYSIEDLDPIDYHYDCFERIRFYYRWRNEMDGALEKAINACEEQIEISADIAKRLSAPTSFLGGIIPHHTGYEQLGIIYEKRKDYEDAIAISERGMAQGWSNDFQKRIDRCRKKMTRALGVSQKPAE